ncbi:uncharacterized mitochondrial protein AtMg00310-like [Cannabis sativa]|uniref:uncharacterized mitochondrial protein AtMg00310-like n=1 Tax=Cannabis sativa TaxID=3483 RepID=UPI0029CA236E|nr:uncharacterized mitochondrial protein AtMg00310-like [Cannabis sativa]
MLGMLEATDGTFYLGLPNIIGRNKTSILGFLKNKVMARINSWDGKFLSRAGKEILLKTVIQSLPTYAMSVFLIPLGICEDIEKLMASFWWKTTSSKDRGITWMSWERMAKPKLEGGMGFQHLHYFNIAMLAKQDWRLLCKPDSLVGQIFKAKYFPTSDYLSVDLGNNPSFVWRSVWAAQSVVRLGVVRIIGNGETTRILSTPWMSDTENRLVTSTHPALLHNTKNKPQHSSADNSGFWRKMWHLKIPPKVKNLLWRAITDCLPTCLQLVTKHVSISALCPVCTNQAE